MIREFMLWVSEMLFYVQGGVMLINTPWIAVWVLFWSIVIASPLIFWIHISQNNWAMTTFIIMFFPALLVATGPGVIQTQMMQECEIVELENTLVNLDDEIVDLGPLSVNRCRMKDNYYGDFGEWKTMGRAQ